MLYPVYVCFTSFDNISIAHPIARLSRAVLGGPLPHGPRGESPGTAANSESVTLRSRMRGGLDLCGSADTSPEPDHRLTLTRSLAASGGAGTDPVPPTRRVGLR